MKQSLWYFLCRYFFFVLSDNYFVTLIRKIQFFRLGIKYYPINLSNPLTFTDHINRIKNYPNTANQTLVADKFLVRDYVKERIGSKYLVPLIGVYDNIDQIRFSDLPHSFVLKANHGSGWNLIVRDKARLKFEQTLSILKSWLGRNAYYLSREKQYRDIQPRIICEQLIGYEPNDYKFFCFRGIPKVVQVDYARFTNHERSIFDLNWKVLDIHIRYKKISSVIEKPTQFTKMIEIASKLSSDFEFARIDLYEVSGQIFFGEITLFPGGGVEPFHSYEEDLLMGKYFSGN